MKQILAVLLLVIFALPVVAQVNPGKMSLRSGKTYVMSTNDTSRTFKLAASLASLRTMYRDSINVITLVEKSTNAGSTWAFACGDTLDQTGGGAVTGNTYRELLLRVPGTNSLGSVDGLFRVVNKFQATVVGVTTPTYDQWIAIGR